MAINLLPGAKYFLSEKVFTTNYKDKDGDDPCEIYIISLPDETKLDFMFEDVKVKVGDVIKIKDADKIYFIRKVNSLINTSFNFKISDNNQNKLLSNMATVTISIAAHVNQKPSRIGNLSVSIQNKATRIFTKADFTTLTTPTYSDPEGDAPSKLKVTKLPTEGTLRLNAVAVTVNQEIPFSEIDAGLLSYVSNQSNPNAASVTFDFEISDVGSNQFTA